MASVIVLAGGYARRFQKKGERWVDKLLVEFEGEHIIKTYSCKFYVITSLILELA